MNLSMNRILVQDKHDPNFKIIEGKQNICFFVRH